MADGYARASGKVGVCDRDLRARARPTWSPASPPRCSTRRRWSASPGRCRPHAIGSDAFQEIDITGVTLPITKHNYLVTRAEDIAPTIREAFDIARSGRPGPVLVDITKDAQQATARFDPERRAGRAADAAPPAYRRRGRDAISRARRR